MTKGYFLLVPDVALVLRIVEFSPWLGVLREGLKYIQLQMCHCLQKKKKDAHLKC